MKHLREAWWYANLVQERLSFTVWQLLRIGRARTYTARGTSTRVLIRHRSGDASVMHEVWRSGDYAPPPEAAARLRRLRPLRVLDLGGHTGLFSAYVLHRFPDAQIISFEPDPGNHAALRRCIAANAAGRSWSVVEACAAPADGTVGFVDRHSAMSHVAHADETPTLQLRAIDVLPHLEAADFVKIDIEGAEWPILADPRFATARPAVVVMEWHSVPGAAVDNPKRRAIDALEKHGYRLHHPTRHADLPVDEPLWSAGVLWAWLPERAPTAV